MKKEFNMIAIEQRKEIEMKLPQHEVVNIESPLHGLSIECEQGVLWVTCAGDIHDYTLGAGESYTIQDANFVVIEAIKDAVLKLRDASEDPADQAAF